MMVKIMSDSKRIKEKVHFYVSRLAGAVQLEIFLKKNNISKNSTIDFKVAKSEVEFIKSITLSFSKESITNFSLLSEVLRLIIFDIRTKVNTLNELADRIDFFFKQSFTPGMSSNNIEIIETNINSNYDFYLTNSKMVVERIKEIFELEKDKTA